MAEVEERTERSEQALYTIGFTLVLFSIPAIFVNSVVRSTLATVAIVVCMVVGVLLIVLAAVRGESPFKRFRQMGLRSKVAFWIGLGAALLTLATIPLGTPVIYCALASVSIIALGMFGSSLRHDERERRQRY